MMSATLQTRPDNNSPLSFDVFESTVGHAFGARLVENSPFLLRRPWTFVTPPGDEYCFPKKATSTAETEWTTRACLLIAKLVRERPCEVRPLTFVISRSKDLNARLLLELRGHLPEWRHCDAHMHPKAFLDVTTNGAVRPTVVYGCDTLSTGVNCPGQVNMVVLPKPVNRRYTPSETYEFDYRKSTSQQAVRSSYWFSSQTFFRQACGRLVRNETDRGVVLFFDAMDATNGRRSGSKPYVRDFFADEARPC